MPIDESNESEVRTFLANAVADIERSWICFNMLYADSETEHHDALQAFHRKAFHVYTQFVRALFQNTIMGLSRLADKPEVFGRENLSIEAVYEHLVRAIASNRSEQVPLYIETRYKDLIDYLRNDKFRLVRDKVFAHNDLKTIMNADPIDVELKHVRFCVGYLSSYTSRVFHWLDKKPLDPSSTKWMSLDPIFVSDVREQFSAFMSLISVSDAD